MNWFIILPTVIVFICIIILITKISIKLMLLYTPTEQHITVQVRVWFIRYTFNVLTLLEKKRKNKVKEAAHAEEEEQEHATSDWIEKLPELIKSIGDIHTISKDFLHKVKVKKLQWRSHLGTGDAASTGIIAGYVWSVKGLIIGIVSSYMKLVKTPSLEVVPIFQGKISATELECIISFRIGQGFLAAFKLFRYFQKNRTMFIDKAVTNIRG